MHGKFVYERKAKGAEWTAVASLPLSRLKAGEGVRLDLHSGEVLNLFRGIVSLYRLYRQQGIPAGRNTFVRLEAGLARFLELSEPDLTKFLDTHKDDAARTLAKLVSWASVSGHGAELVMNLSALVPEQLPSFAALTGIAAVKAGLAFLSDNLSNSSEDFWQTALERNSYLLNQAFAYPVVVIGSKAYVGGKQINNQGGTLADFLAAVESTAAVVIIEIKTPQARLLGPEGTVWGQS